MCLERRGEKALGVIFKAMALEELPKATCVWKGSELRGLSPDELQHGEVGYVKKDQQE